MDKAQFTYYRKRLGLTQKEIAQLLLSSLKTIHSYEQGWRNIPASIERQIYFLIYAQNRAKEDVTPCWIVKKCPPAIKNQCPAWKFNEGPLCWFVTGTLCEGKPTQSWKEKIRLCKQCNIFKKIMEN